MEHQPTTMLRIGAWCVDPRSGQISRNGETARVELRTMRLLLCLAERAGEVVSIDDLLERVWSGLTVTPDSVYQAVASLRRLLGDDPRQPTYIATVPRLGYKMIAPVSPWPNDVDQVAHTAHAAQLVDSPERSVSESPVPARTQGPISLTSAPARRRLPTYSLILSAAAICAVLVSLVVFPFHGNFANRTQPPSPAVSPQPDRSIAVLPFLDLTDQMNQEPFADGMTEELIDKLAKIPGVHVPPPTSSFYFKGKQIPVAEIARSLGVAYVLDGSVRKSGIWVRVAARLIRADNGYVVWSESYDRPFDDILTVQDEIAGEVTKALRASIDPAPTRDTPR